ncbi:MAG: hypothetical protein MJ001_07365 [Paludibacteraceae bacterium]|nr:hypothetical protein [Candidatus Colousia faecequi]MCQ2338721.1 hypothetical protein [Paludibacteraceae bacterium]
MEKKNIVILVIAGAVIVVLLAVVLYLSREMRQKDVEMAEMVEQMEYEKEELANEYADVAIEMEGISYKVTNDSLLAKINKEQKRIQALQEELRTVKATNARRIKELKEELASVRKVLTYYVAQVDSLSRVNTQLKNENAQLGAKYAEATSEVQRVTEEREVLQEKVNIASQLEARDIEVEAQKKSGKKARYIKNVTLFEVSYKILKNNTARVGNKTVYLRITCPDGSVLHKQANNKFVFEDKQIYYSAKKNFEYAGNEMGDVLYYNVAETLLKGTYEFELFVDGHLIGGKKVDFTR